MNVEIEDIARFCDPFTEPKVRVGKTLSISLIRHGREISYEIDTVTEKVSAKDKRSVFPNIRSLLASAEFANLGQLARTQIRAYKSEGRSIPSTISLNGTRVAEMAATDFLNQGDGGMRLLLIDGAAGVGKTHFIRNMVIAQANSIDKGRAGPLVLHVNSKGRRLSNLSDVLASSTQELGAGFGAIQVPALVRHGLLAIAIDGFDELVDADGYEDSWSALRSFLSDVGSFGTVILSARDTFVEEQELLTKIKRSKDEIELSTLNIRPPSQEDAIGWLSQSPSWKQADIASPITKDILAEESYALRPFFLRELQGAKGWKDVLDVGPRSFLANRLLHREAVLIAQQLGGVTAEEIKPRFQSLLEEISLEMGAREVDWIEVEHLGFMTDYCFDDILDESNRRKLMYKSGSFAFLEVAGAPNRRSFSHAEIKNYFLGAAVLSGLSREQVPSVLRRTSLSAEHADVFSEVFANDPRRLDRATEFLLRQLALLTSNDSLTSNFGTLLLMTSGLKKIDRLDYLEVIDATLAGGVVDVIISESRLGRVDACGANLQNFRLVKSSIETLVVDGRTVLGEHLCGIQNLEIRMGGKAEIIRGERRVDEYIKTVCDAAKPPSDPDRYLEYFERVVRRLARHHYLREYGGDDEGALLLQDVRWPHLREVLDKHNRLEVVKKPMKGVGSNLIRINRVQTLLDSTHPETVALLADLVVARAKVGLKQEPKRP